MFTGLVAHLGKVESATRQGDGITKLVVAALIENIVIGESVLVSGACLTVTAWSKDTITFDVSSETTDVSTIGRLRRGDAVNLERALALGERLGGHLVSGHVDTVGTIRSVRQLSGAVVIEVVVGSKGIGGIVPKGSVAVDGISLTVNDVTADAFSLTIIPHTIANTTLKDRRPGDEVNVEFDMLGKYVHRYLDTMRDGKNIDELLKDF